MHLIASVLYRSRRGVFAGALLFVLVLPITRATRPPLARAGSFGSFSIDKIEVCGRCNEAKPSNSRRRPRRPSGGSNNAGSACSEVRRSGYRAEVAGRLNDAEELHRRVLGMCPNDRYSTEAVSRILEKLELREDRRRTKREAAEVKSVMYEKVDALRFDKGSRTSAPVLVMQGPLEWSWEGKTPASSHIAYVRKVQRRLSGKWAADFEKLKKLQERIDQGDRRAQAAFRKTRRRIREGFAGRMDSIHNELLQSHLALYHSVITKTQADIMAEMNREFDKGLDDILIEDLLADLGLMSLGEPDPFPYGSLSAEDRRARRSKMERDFYKSYINTDPQYALKVRSVVAFCEAKEKEKIMRARVQAVRDMRRAYTLLEQQGILKKGEDLVAKTRNDPVFRKKIYEVRNRILGRLDLAEMRAVDVSREWLRRKFKEIHATK